MIGLSSRIRARPSFYLNVVRLIKNYPVFLLDWFGLYPSSEVEIIMRNGTKFVIRSKEDAFVFNEIVFYKIYTPQGFEIKDNYTVIDLGAHIGIFTVLASTSAKGVKVFSYEPFPQSFGLLRRNVSVNHLEKVKIYPLAVGRTRSERKLYLDKANLGGHSLHWVRDDWMLVSCITLTDVFDSNGIEKCDLLKMDIEGAEYEILFNTPSKYLGRIDRVVLECHKGVQNSTAEEMKAFLESSGFFVTRRKSYPVDIMCGRRQ